MTILLTIVAILLVPSIIGLIVWDAAHRRSDIVKAWNPSSFPGRVTGGLGMHGGGSPTDRLGDDDPETIVLIHGLGGTADYFGDLYEGLAIDHRLVMVDLLGFGLSIDDHRTDFTIDAHVDAIDGALASVGAGNDRVCLAAFSMGSGVALAWAARHPERTTEVILWGPPTYPGEMTDAEIIERSGLLTRTIWSKRPMAIRLSEWVCRHRWAAGWVMAAFAPRFPIDMSRRASLHSRASYLGSLDALVLGPPWPELFTDVQSPVTVFRGTEDTVGRRDYLAAVGRRATIVHVEGADHHVPLTHPHLLFDHLGV